MRIRFFKSFSVNFSLLGSSIFFFDIMIKGTYFLLIASFMIAWYFLVIIRMIKFFNFRMTLFTKYTVWTSKPALILISWTQCNLTIVLRIFKYFVRSSEISHVMCKNTFFWIMGILIQLAPSRFISKHVKLIYIHRLEFFVKILIKKCRSSYAFNHTIIFSMSQIILYIILFDHVIIGKSVVI